MHGFEVADASQRKPMDCQPLCDRARSFQRSVWRALARAFAAQALSTLALICVLTSGLPSPSWCMGRRQGL